MSEAFRHALGDREFHAGGLNGRPVAPVKDGVQGAHGPAEFPAAFGIGHAIRFLRQSWPLIALCSLVLSTLALAYALLVTPSYTASAQVIYDPVTAQAFLDDDDKSPDAGRESSTRIDSQVEVIKSDRIATDVARRLSLGTDPEFGGGHWSLSPMSWFSTNTATSSDALASVAVTSRLAVRRVGQSAVIEIAFSSNNPEKSARIANAIAQAYVDLGLGDKADAARRGSAWLQKRIDSLRSQVFQAMSDVEDFKSKGAGSANESRVRLAELESIAQAYQRMYESFLLKNIETEQRFSYPVGDGRLVSAASESLTVKSPKRGVIVLFAAFVGALLGAGTALARNASDWSLRNPLKVAQGTGTPFLGAVTRVENAPVAVRPLRFISRAKNLIAEQLRPSRSRPRDLNLLKIFANPAPMTRDLRRIKAAVASRIGQELSPVLGVVSVTSGAGATTIAAGLARLYAAGGVRTLLIDANVENQSLTRIFAPGSDAAGSQAATPPSSMSDLTVEVAALRCSLLPLGNAEGTASLIDILGSKAGLKAFQALTRAFDMVLVDLPPLLTSADAHAVATALDGFIVVGEFGATPEQGAVEEITGLLGARANVLGLVLNKVPDFARHELSL